MALLVSKSQQLYSYSTYDVLPVRGHIPTTSTRTGIATVLRSVGPLYILGFATGGMATSADGTTGSFSGGGIAVWKFKTGLTIELGARLAKAGGVSLPIYELGLGKTF